MTLSPECSSYLPLCALTSLPLNVPVTDGGFLPSGGLGGSENYSVNFTIACEVVNTAIPVFIALNPSFL